ncbi:PH-like domain-containing protein [Microbacterium radiodurans]|uniref:PH domain-containing protein n=1 Tax=Microbacterium radiodurans TaxID=661398 RepID=A0A5J5IQL1_9MICO|nr:hypothetical protein [Microbacterium radiodurans]KAA9086715.1 hypothetical protein F6B42_06835 [Microbacterium radiodurans]
MSREAALIVMVVVALALLGLGVWAWRRRTRRDSGLHAPVGEAPADAATLAQFSGLYVATTRRDEPLERLAIRRLGFRSRVDVVVTTGGVALDLTGQPRLFIATDRIDGVDQATVAIDRVVEKEGLARLSWRLDGQHPVDSYFRPQTSSARALVDAIRTIPHFPLTPGGDA